MTSKYDPNRNTLQSKFGFQDDDLKSSKHDEIMLWLDGNIENLIEKHLMSLLAEEKFEMEKRTRNYLASDMKWNEEKKNETLTEYDRLCQKDLAISSVSKVWEVPVLSGNYTVGFVDFLVYCYFEVVGYNYQL